MKKTPNIILALAVAGLLASCGADGPGSTPTTSEEPASTNDSATVAPATSDTEASTPSGDLISLDALHIILYEKQVTEKAAVDAWKTTFEAYVAEKGYAIENLTYDYVGSGKVATLDSELQAFEAEEGNYPGDVILGAKAIAAADAPWINENFYTYTVDGANFEFDFGGNTTRRLWIRNDDNHEEARRLVINYFRNQAGLDDETDEPDGSSDASSEESIPASSEESIPASSEESIPDSSDESIPDSSEDSSGALEPVTYDALHVILYDSQISDRDAVVSFFSDFDDYLEEQQITITAITKDYLGTGKVATLDSELQAFEAEEGNYPGDVILGAKAIAASSAAWINEKFTTYTVDGANFEFDFGGNTARRIWTRNDSANSDAVQALVNFCLTLVG